VLQDLASGMLYRTCGAGSFFVHRAGGGKSTAPRRIRPHTNRAGTRRPAIHGSMPEGSAVISVLCCQPGSGRPIRLDSRYSHWPKGRGKKMKERTENRKRGEKRVGNGGVGAGQRACRWPLAPPRGPALGGVPSATGRRGRARLGGGACRRNQRFKGAAFPNKRRPAGLFVLLQAPVYVFLQRGRCNNSIDALRGSDAQEGAQGDPGVRVGGAECIFEHSRGG